MGPDFVVIRSVGFQHTTQVRFIEHDDMIEAFTADRSDEALNVPVLPQ